MINKRHIDYYKGIYDATEDGNILSFQSGSWETLKRSEMKKRINAKKGYLFVNLSVKNEKEVCYVHRLVAQKYLPNPHNYPVVLHLDNDKHNNHVSNLKWGTHKDNMQQARADGLFSVTEKVRESARKNGRVVSKKVMQLTKEGILCRIYDSCAEASRVLGVTKSAICTCARGESKTCCGYYWKLV